MFNIKFNREIMHTNKYAAFLAAYVQTRDI